MHKKRTDIEFTAIWRREYSEIDWLFLHYIEIVFLCDVAPPTVIKNNPMSVATCQA